MASAETSEETEKEEQAAAGKAVTKEEFRGEGTVLAPRFEVADGSGGTPGSTFEALRIKSPGPVPGCMRQEAPKGLGSAGEAGTPGPGRWVTAAFPITLCWVAGQGRCPTGSVTQHLTLSKCPLISAAAGALKHRDVRELQFPSGASFLLQSIFVKNNMALFPLFNSS